MIMRRVCLLFVLLGFWIVDCHAQETMRASNHAGLMCTDEKTLADLTANDGSLKQSAQFPPESDAFAKYCQRVDGPVTLIKRRKNTSIVSFNGKTWYVPNIDFVESGANAPCIKSGTTQTLFGRMETGYAKAHDPKTAYFRYKLDQPVCLTSAKGQAQSEYMSLVPTSEHSQHELLNIHEGSRYPVTGIVIAPRNANDPPDSVMMLDPETWE